MECYDETICDALSKAHREFSILQKRSVVFTRGRPFLIVTEIRMSIVMKFGGTSVADAAALENVRADRCRAT